MKTRFLKSLLIPLLLTIGYAILISYPYLFSKINRYDSLGFLSLVEEKSVNIQKTFSPERKTDRFDNHLFKGEKVSGKIKATENNFGILLFRFAKLSLVVSDVVTFRIKKEGEDKWYYENNYRANQFQPDQYFTFGFPPFKDSKNNTFIFEIESLSGTYKNGIGISLTEPQVALVYKYTLEDLKNYKMLSSFIFKKFVYVMRHVNFLQNWQILVSFLFSYIFLLSVKERKFIVPKNRVFLLDFKRKAILISKRVNRWFARTKFYLLFLNTNTKKGLAVGLLIFLFALTYRFSSSLVNQDKFFYAGLGGQGDYDQFIRAATCSLKFCPYAILGQNFLFETTILGTFYEIFGFTGGLKAYLYLMIILSSIVATLPHFLLSRKSWITIGGIIGSFLLVFSDFLTRMALNFPPDNGSTFTFSMFFIIYLLTLHRGTVRWLLFFGLMGTIDGLNKALFLINDPMALAIFAPVFFFEKIKEKVKSTIGRSASGGKKAMQAVKAILRKENIKILFLSLTPLLTFLIIYSAWENFIYIKFSAHYWLWGLVLSRGESYIYYTSAYDNSFLMGGILYKLFFLIISAIVMVKRLIEYANLQIIFLVPIFWGLLFFTLRKPPFDKLRAGEFPVKKFIPTFILSVALIALLTLIKNNYFKVHEIFAKESISDNWTYQTYIGIFLFYEIVILFILNFKYQAIKLTLPIIPYVIMLIVLTINSPFPRISTQVVVWMIILLAYLIDWMLVNANRYTTRGIRIILGPVFLILIFLVYIVPRTTTMITKLYAGFVANQNQVKYLRWVDSNLPSNAVILAGGKSDLATVAENIKRPIVYNILWAAAVLIKPKEIPGVGASDFSIVSELKNKNNFKKNKYVILDDDIYVWRARVSGIADNVFSTDLTILRADDYSIKVYKYNQTLKKAIYELNIREIPSS